ncbi:double-strand break repair helicase AddA [Alteraurantiacibacter palmitatis]|uniref:DNA 3'-5' helicase n=1 Tax=Alteraurantiacibacter palmitatis TaxID=2054628 RepID=A0ABV7E0U6_9SPHN
MSGKLFRLQDNQRDAVDPQDSVWLSASAGTGKTQVLSARVLRLLLRPDVRPDNILCLTFTKAGAAEMATRVNEVLARWVRMDDAELAGELDKIGADMGPETVSRARTLFASVLDCPGGGLRIDTIHAFSQWLLSAFPAEAGLEAGARPMEDRDRDLLAHKVLSQLVADWQEEHDGEAIAALEMLSERLSPDETRKWLVQCAAAPAAWHGPGAFQPPMRPLVHARLGLAEGETREGVAAWCSDAQFDCAALRQIADAYHAWGTNNAQPYVNEINRWFSLDEAGRLDCLANLRNRLFNAEGQLKYAKNIAKFDPDIGAAGDDLLTGIDAVLQRKCLFDLADLLAPALDIGRRYALAWEEAKRREGLLDFDDLIRSAAALLGQAGVGDWIRYKLDRRFDHILIDEAQDTNEAQWSIIDALTGDFFAGLGQRDDKLRTLFVVGDYKQAIFGFQGTSPENFAAARDRYRRQLAERVDNVAAMRANVAARELVELPLGRSYRTAQDVLDFVDRAVEAIGPDALGLTDDYEPHRGDAARPGLVRLWQPVRATDSDEEGEGGEEGGDADPWLSAPERRMAGKIAAQIRDWMDHGFPLVKGGARNAGPGDVMVLVRKRRELAGLIVARLHAAGVPVAGVDRLRLGAPLAVKDLMAALRFAVQPGDDLSLAALLVSPIFGWRQEELLQHGYRGKIGLWEHLLKSDAPRVRAAVEMLLALLARADFEPPQALLHWMLIGPWRARAKLTARLGRDANDPIDELLNAAHAFAAAHVPSLQGFIHWFDAGAGELKRESGEGSGARQVRVMTVHGSKGLQAPIVILADATGDPHRPAVSASELPGDAGLGQVAMPLPPLAKDMKTPAIAEADAQAQAENLAEHWRLLYVAMTRAEEALFIGGALGKKEKEAKPDSWYARLAPLFPEMPEHDAIWGGRQDWGSLPEPILKVPQDDQGARIELPGWALTPVGPEPRPPRPLAPSAAGQEQGADPPLPPEVAALAARRGVLMHKLIERLPDIAPADREKLGSAWLARLAADLPEAERTDMLARSIAVIAHPDWAELFGPSALAEVPLAATVGGQVIAGTADRLLVEEHRVLVADFKTARRPPASLDQMQQATVRQMAAYVAALEVIFPGKAVEAAVLYTQTPQLIAIPSEILAAHKPALGSAE